MPRIQEYSSQVRPSGPVDRREFTAADFGGLEARGLQNLGAGVQEVASVINQRQEQDEISSLSAKLSEVQANYTNKWHDKLRTAENEDIPTLRENFLKEFDDEFSKVGENVSSSAAKNYLKRAGGDLRQYFNIQAFEGQAQLAGAKAKQDFVTSVNSMSGSLINSPSAFEMSLKRFDETLKAQVKSGLPATAAEGLSLDGKAKLAESAVRGWIQLDPAAAKAQLNSGKWDQYISGDQKHQLFSEATQFEHAQKAEAERQEREAEKLKKQEQENTQNALLKKFVAGNISAQDILNSNLDPFGSGSKQQFINMLEAEAKSGGTIKTDPGTWKDTFTRIHLPEGDPRKITDEGQLNELVVQGRLGYEDLTRFRNELAGKKTIQGQAEATLKKSFIQMATGQISKSNPLVGKLDTDGDRRAYEFQFLVEQKIEEQRKAGKPIEDLFDAHHASYLGRYIGKFQKSTEEVFRDMANPVRGMPAPIPTSNEPVPTGSPSQNPKARRTAESIADWRKRTKDMK